MRRLLRTRWALALAVLVLGGAITAILMTRGTATASSDVVARVKRGDFKVVVTTAGELRALRGQITGPPTLQQAQVFNVKIASLVPEGTVVKEGDIVAELDRASIATQAHRRQHSRSRKAQAVYEQAQLDSTLNLSKAREEIRTMELGLEEKKLAKEQAIYEAPTVKRQAEIDYEKASARSRRPRRIYDTKTEQAQAKMREVGADLRPQRNKLKIVQDVMQGFTITAPGAGMVIYVKEWNGKKSASARRSARGSRRSRRCPTSPRWSRRPTSTRSTSGRSPSASRSSITLDSDPTKKLTGKVTAGRERR